MFDFNNLSKIMEQNQLTIQYLYSTAIERKLTKEDFDNIKTQDQDPYIYEIWTNCIISLTQDEQIEFYKSISRNKDIIDEYVEYLKETNEKIDKLVNSEVDDNIHEHMNESEERLINYGIELYNEMFNKTLYYVAKIIQKIHASIFRKIVVSLLSNGININRIMDLQKKRVDKTELIVKIRSELEKMPEGLDKERVKDYLCKRFDIRPEDV